MSFPSTRPTLDINDFIEIGAIVASQGLKGEVRVYPSSDFPERFEEPGLRWLQYPNSHNIQPIQLLQGRPLPGKNLYVLRLEGIENQEQAESLRGCKLLVEKRDRPQLEEDEYHVSDLVNLEVYSQATGELIGVVSDLFWAGNDLLEVTLHQPLPPLEDTSKYKKKEKKPVNKVYIPFVKEIVPIVNLEAKRIEITPPPGLLEVNQS